jgi:hypothetical protein
VFRELTNPTTSLRLNFECFSALKSGSVAVVDNFGIKD